MLLRFGVENHLSMRDRQELSLAASPLRDGKTGLIDCAGAPNGQALPAAMIYGPNASGKSNLVAALSAMRTAILYSHSRGEPGGHLSRKPFALDPKCAEAPSIFDIDFVIDDVRYHYGFATYYGVFFTEWLHAFPNNRRQTLFERRGQSFDFGRGLKGRNKVISDLTRPNSLFLSAAAQNHHDHLSKVAAFFRSLHIDTEIPLKGTTAAFKSSKKEPDGRVIAFLDKIGTGVVGYRLEKEKTVAEMRAEWPDFNTMMENLEDEFPEFDMEKEWHDVTVQLAHRGHGGKEIYFDLDRESAGTRRLLVLLGHVFRVLDDGAVLVVDELDASLHTQACEAVLALFSSPETNPRGAQIVATTHDTNLLRSPLLRRDQVWFAEKDAGGATHLYPLTDIRTRKDDNIAKGYLQGRFGAIPFPGPSSRAAKAG